jgi:hypothetical protein
MTGNGGFSMPIKRLTGGCKWHRFTNMNQWSGCLKPGSSQRRFRIPLQGESQGGKPGLSASAARATGLPAWSFRDSSTGDFSIEKVVIQSWAIVIYITRKSCDLSMKHVDLIKIQSNKNGDQNWDISWESLTKTSYGRGVPETGASLAPPWKRARNGYPWLILAP